MAKTKISEFDTNPDFNTDINSINIAEGCSPAGINNAIRQLMADLKEWQSGAQDRYIVPAGTAAAPSVTVNGDLDTGLYSAAANELGVAAGGSAVGKFTSAGFVGNVTGNVSGNVTGDVTGNAVNVTGIVAVANGGTNAVDADTARTNLDVPSRSGSGASGTWGISITGNAATATSASNGGVTSVNGQTGAITNTSIDSIGSYIVALYVPGNHPGGTGYSLSIGDTVSGSALRYGVSMGYSDLYLPVFSVLYTTSQPPVYTGGGSSLSGTWRCVGRPGYEYASTTTPNLFKYSWFPGLFVRVS